MNKRGQYYLIAAIVIITLLIGFATITNSVNKSSQKERLYELYNDANIDAVRIANYKDNEIGYDQQEMGYLLDDLVNIYPGINKEIYFITIPEGSYVTQGITPKFYSYNPTTKSINEITGIENYSVGILKITLNQKEYYFDYDSTKNSYYIIIIEETEEQYVLNGQV